MNYKNLIKGGLYSVLLFSSLSAEIDEQKKISYDTTKNTLKSELVIPKRPLAYRRLDIEIVQPHIDHWVAGLNAEQISNEILNNIPNDSLTNTASGVHQTFAKTLSECLIGYSKSLCNAYKRYTNHCWKKEEFSEYDPEDKKLFFTEGSPELASHLFQVLRSTIHKQVENLEKDNTFETMSNVSIYIQDNIANDVFEYPTAAQQQTTNPLVGTIKEINAFLEKTIAAEEEPFNPDDDFESDSEIEEVE